jgi:hypothetical protein
MKIRPVEAELFDADGATGRQTEKTKPIRAPHNCAKAPKTVYQCSATGSEDGCSANNGQTEVIDIVSSNRKVDKKHIIYYNYKKLNLIM